MDNRITKKRLSNFLAYEWILILVIAVLAIFGWELVYSFAEVNVTYAQTFKYFYDTNMNISNDQAFQNLFRFETEESVFSFDILKFSAEKLDDSANMLGMRLGVHDGDALITSTSVAENAPDGTISKAQYNIDNNPVYKMDDLLTDAEDYLKGFLPDGSNESALIFNNLDEQKIKANFKRLSKDNRKRAGLISEQDEVNRIKMLCKDVTDFKYLLENHPEIFYVAKVPVRDGEQDTGATAKYGLLPEKLTGGVKSSSSFFRANDSASATAKDTVVLIFDMSKHQPHLQYETIAFLNTIVKNCSNITLPSAL